MLGVLALEADAPARAVEHLERAVELAPNMALYFTNLGLAHGRLGAFEPSAQALSRAVELAPELAVAQRNLGLVRCDLGDFTGGIACLERAAVLEPESASNRALLAKGLVRAGRAAATAGNPSGAVDYFERAVALERPLAATLAEEIALAFVRLGRLEDAVAALEAGLALDPALPRARNQLVFLSAFRVGISAAQLLEHARRFGELHAPARPVPEAHPAQDLRPERKLRLGYVSPDFRDHVQRYFVLPVFAAHDRNAFELVCYSSVVAPDAWTARIRDRADVWRDVSRRSDAELAASIREDRIDVLIDLTMHMPGSRLMAFAEHPAPVQLCWLAYPGTTGVSAIDYRISDPHLDPPGDPLPYSERTLRLARSFWCYDPLADEPLVNPLPALRAGHVTFGCLNNAIKLNRETLELWARVLVRLGDSKLVVCAPPGRARSRVLEVLASNGVADTRVSFVDRQSRHDYLATYGRIDVALDSLPYNGHTTTLDALFMGVPVVSRIGETVVGRAGLSIAKNLELEELVARDADEFVTVAVSLARSLPRLSALRSTLRERLRRSPLMDAAGFTRELEGAYRHAWREYCATRTSSVAGATTPLTSSDR